MEAILPSAQTVPIAAPVLTKVSTARAPRIPSLDGIRVAAFTMVFVAHLGYERTIPGGFGVTVFFFLSGFLIATLLRIELERTGSLAIRHFYLRRALRIVPPFLIAIGLASVVTAATGGELKLTMIAAQLGQLTNYAIAFGREAGKPVGSGVVWSLAVEEHFYLVFPLLYLGLHRWLPTPRKRVSVLLAVCAAVLAWRCILVLGLGQTEMRTYYATDTRFDSILFGCVLAEIGNPALDGASRSDRFWKYLALPVGLLFLLGTFIVRDAAFRETVRYTIQGIALIPVFIAVVRYPSWGAIRLLNARPMGHFAELSYTLYLVHYTVILAIEHALGTTGLWTGIIALPMCLALSEGILFAVERPCAKLRKRLAHA